MEFLLSRLRYAVTKNYSGWSLIFPLNCFHESTPPRIFPSQAENGKRLFCPSNTLDIAASRLIRRCFDLFVTDNCCLQQLPSSLLVFSSRDCATGNLRGKLAHEFRILSQSFFYPMSSFVVYFPFIGKL